MQANILFKLKGKSRLSDPLLCKIPLFRKMQLSGNKALLQVITANIPQYFAWQHNYFATLPWPFREVYEQTNAYNSAIKYKGTARSASWFRIQVSNGIGIRF